MKSLAITSIALSLSLPVNAQLSPSVSPSSPSDPSQTQPPISQPPVESNTTLSKKIKRVMGSACESNLADSNKQKTNVRCHHVVITGPDEGTDSMNFHFDTEREDSGVSYVVRNKLQKDKEGRTYYEVVAMFSHESGKPSTIVSAEGLCSTDMKIKEIAVGCIAQTKDGSSSKSVLRKK